MSNKGVQSLDRVLDIIEFLATERVGVGVTEIANSLGLNKSTAHRMLNALWERGYIEKTAKHSNYKLGLKFIEISSLYLNKLELKTEALPYMRKLAEQAAQPVHLAIQDGTDAVYIEKIEAVNSIRMYSEIGKRIPVYCSAIGKIMLSGLKERERDEIIKNIVFSKFTDNTLSTREQLEAEVLDAHKKGWAIDNEEHELGIRCIAAPVYDYSGKIIAALSVSGNNIPEKDEEMSKSVIETANAISKRMGCFKFQ